MIFDKELIFSGATTENGLTGQALDINDANAVNSTNVIDLSQRRDIAMCEDLYLYISPIGQIAPANNEASILEAILIATDSAVDNTAGLAKMIGSIGKRYIKQLNENGPFIVKINPQIQKLGERYLMVKYLRTAGNDRVQGAMFAALTMGVNTQKSYPTGYSII